MSGFFNYFPTFFYANTAAVNVIAKVLFDQSISKNLAVFYPYTLEEGERADQVAETYYEDPSYDWVIYLSNNIIDPYHDWHKDQDVFGRFIAQKYGSISAAQARTEYFRVNHEDDDRIITTAAYDALGTGQKQYWVPQIGYNENVIGYERKELSHIVETNRIVTLSGSFSGIAANDIIKQSGTVTGVVTFSNTSTVIIKHVQGTWANSTPVYNVLTGSTVTANITTVTPTQNSIPTDELSYWTAVTSYEAEEELNEQRKHIRVLGNSYLDLVERDMKELLQV